jgi:hypothetical protein
MRKRKAGTQVKRRVETLLPWQTEKWPAKDSDLWPESCRGDKWNRGTAMLYVGKCQMCEHACHPPEGRRRMDAMAFLPTFLLCTRHPDHPGQLHQVDPMQRCANYHRRRARQQPRRRKRRNDRTGQCDFGTYESYDNACRIELSGGYFAIVDREDFEELSKYKWSASNIRGRVFAVRRTKDGHMVTMHREIIKPRKGYVVDHVNHNVLDARRCNLRECTSEQNYANAGPRGASSGFVGVWQHGKKWVAGINWQGKHYYLGIFDDAVSAAKARDRKAYELHGPYAYLNFPEEIKKEFAAAARRKA